MYKKQAQAAFTPVSNFCSAPDFLYSDVIGHLKNHRSYQFYTLKIQQYN